MRISIEMHNSTFSFEQDNDHITLDEMMLILRSLLLATGHAEEGINEYIGAP